MHPMFAGFRTGDGKKKTGGTNQSAIEMTERPSAVKTEKSFLVKLSFMHSWCSGNISDRQSLVSGSNPDGCSKTISVAQSQECIHIPKSAYKDKRLSGRNPLAYSFYVLLV